MPSHLEHDCAGVASTPVKAFELVKALKADLYLLAMLGQLLFKCNSLHITYYLQLNYLVTVTYYPYNKEL